MVVVAPRRRPRAGPATGIHRRHRPPRPATSLEALGSLREQGIASLLVEGGGQLAGALLAARPGRPLLLDSGPALAGRGRRAGPARGSPPVGWTRPTGGGWSSAGPGRRHAAGPGSALMFTGIVTGIGTVRSQSVGPAAWSSTIESRLSRSRAGRERRGGRRMPDGGGRHALRSSRSMWSRTTLTGPGSASTPVGRRVNLERALRVGDRLGGHLVQAHVDGVGTVDLVTERRGRPGCSISGSQTRSPGYRCRWARSRWTA